MRILAICGSLRANSANLAALQAVAALAPESASVRIYEGLGSIPLFNPDLDSEPGLPAVAAFRTELRESDGILVCSPEYAHGIPGVLKNALDWVVGSGELSGKPVAILNASPQSAYVSAALLEVLRAMNTRAIAEACITLPFVPRPVTAEALLARDDVRERLRRSLADLTQAIAG